MDFRRSKPALFALPLYLCACAAAPKAAVSSPAEAPAQARTYLDEDAWRFSGASTASFSNTDIGDVETTTIGVSATGGKLISPSLLIEGVFDFENSSTEAGNADIDQTELRLGVGARYYFNRTGGSTFPYVRGEAGLAFVDVDANGAEDDDSSPYLGIGAGAETFLTQSIALDYGLRFLYAFDVFDDELTDLALYIGFSVWI